MEGFQGDRRLEGRDSMTADARVGGRWSLVLSLVLRSTLGAAIGGGIRRYPQGTVTLRWN